MGKENTIFAIQGKSYEEVAKILTVGIHYSKLTDKSGEPIQIDLTNFVEVINNTVAKKRLAEQIANQELTEEEAEKQRKEEEISQFIKDMRRSHFVGSATDHQTWQKGWGIKNPSALLLKKPDDIIAKYNETNYTPPPYSQGDLAGGPFSGNLFNPTIIIHAALNPSESLVKKTLEISYLYSKKNNTGIDISSPSGFRLIYDENNLNNWIISIGHNANAEKLKNRTTFIFMSQEHLNCNHKSISICSNIESALEEAFDMKDSPLGILKYLIIGKRVNLPLVNIFLANLIVLSDTGIKASEKWSNLKEPLLELNCLKKITFEAHYKKILPLYGLAFGALSGLVVYGISSWGVAGHFIPLGIKMALLAVGGGALSFGVFAFFFALLLYGHNIYKKNNAKKLYGDNIEEKNKAKDEMIDIINKMPSP